jgi:ribosome-associated protein
VIAPRFAHTPAMIRLDQLLKLTGAADSGGQAKAFIQGGKVKVNGEVDKRRGRKLQAGDTVEIAGRTIAVDAALLRRAPDEDDGTDP